ncbi:unnamed protein product, partial [Pleuronectes platessa]
MDGPQACSRWARQPQPQLRHFKKPLVGPLPGPSSHTGRSEAPENSETSPREKGNLGLPVLLTDGSTHLEQIVGSDQAVLSQDTIFCGVKSGAPADAQDTSVREGAKVTGADELFKHNTGVLRVSLPSSDSAAAASSASGVWRSELWAGGTFQSLKMKPQKRLETQRRGDWKSLGANDSLRLDTKLSEFRAPESLRGQCGAEEAQW